jgi:hypothetical protein
MSNGRRRRSKGLKLIPASPLRCLRASSSRSLVNKPANDLSVHTIAACAHTASSRHISQHIRTMRYLRKILPTGIRAHSNGNRLVCCLMHLARLQQSQLVEARLPMHRRRARPAEDHGQGRLAEGRHKLGEGRHQVWSAPYDDGKC